VIVALVSDQWIGLGILGVTFGLIVADLIRRRT